MSLPRGICKGCGKSKALNKDGTVRGHGYRPNDPNAYWCDGAWKRPVAPQRSLSHPPDTLKS